MTDNRTNEPTPEQIIEDALRNSYASGSALARLIVSDLHAHGLLSGGAQTAVPDAANRELTEAIRLTVEYVGNDMLPAIEGWDWYDALVKYAPEVAQSFVDKPIHFPKPTDAEAERDAALAAIERVRAIHYPVPAGDVLPDKQLCANETCEGFYPCPTVAALDGAPEPEWEERTIYGSQLESGHITIEVRGPNYSTHKRTARYGPWLLVEGEKP